MENPRYYVPSGLPPGLGPMAEQDGPPEGVYYYRIYGGIMAVLCALMTLAGMGMFLVPLLTVGGAGGASPGGLGPGEMVAGVIYGGMGVILLVPFLLSLFGGRHGWVHTLGTVLIAVSMMSLCCVPFAIPVLVMWLKPETKRWYGMA